MVQILYYTLLVIVAGLPILGVGIVLWSDYQNYQQSKRDKARRIREEELKAEFINLYGGEDKFYHDMRKAYNLAHEASEALSMYNWIKKSGSDSWESPEAYLEEHKTKAALYYKLNPEFKLKDYINLHLNN